MTITLEDLNPTIETIHAAGNDIPLKPLRMRDFTKLLKSYPAIGAVLSVEAEKRPAVLVKALVEFGADAVNDVLDASIGWQAGSAAKAPFTAIEEGRMLLKIAQISLPSADLEKLWAEASAVLTDLGLTTENDQTEA